MQMLLRNPDFCMTAVWLPLQTGIVLDITAFAAGPQPLAPSRPCNPCGKNARLTEGATHDRSTHAVPACGGRATLRDREACHRRPPSCVSRTARAPRTTALCHAVNASRIDTPPRSAGGACGRSRPGVLYPPLCALHTPVCRLSSPRHRPCGKRAPATRASHSVAECRPKR